MNPLASPSGDITVIYSEPPEKKEALIRYFPLKKKKVNIKEEKT